MEVYFRRIAEVLERIDQRLEFYLIQEYGCNGIPIKEGEYECFKGYDPDDEEWEDEEDEELEY